MLGPANSRLILVRHGESEFNALHRDGGALFCGQFETPLTELGRQQARRTGRTLAARTDLAVRRAVSSALGRARETLDLLLLDLPPAVERLAPDPALNERSLGLFEGRSEADVFARHPEYRDDPILARFRADMVQKAPGGENLTEVANRAWSRIARLLAELPPGSGDLLVVSHAMTIRCVVGRACRIDSADWPALRVSNAAPFLLAPDPTLPDRWRPESPLVFASAPDAP